MIFVFVKDKLNPTAKMQMLPTVQQVEWELTGYRLCVLHLAKFLMLRIDQGTQHLHHANQVMIDDEIDDKTVVDRMTNVNVVLASDPLGSAGYFYCLHWQLFHRHCLQAQLRTSIWVIIVCYSFS